MSSFGLAIREARQKRKWTQAELAQRLSVSPDTISGWENDDHEPRPAERKKLQRLFPELAGIGETVRISHDGTPDGERRSDLKAVGGTMLAQRMTRHWERIARTSELTGPSLIPLLEDEARWFREHEYWDAFDATLDLIRDLRWIEKKRGRS